MNKTRKNEINQESKVLDNWQDKLKYIVIQSNRVIYEELTGIKTTISDLITCSELAYLTGHADKKKFRSAIKSLSMY